MAEYVSKEAAMDCGTLTDWYISSVSEDDTPVWTDEHIEELLKDFLVIPKETPAADVQPVRHGHWIDTGINVNDGSGKREYQCSSCNDIFFIEPSEIVYYKFCPYCSAKMDGGEASES